jgi:hypothetical protein
MKPAGASAGSAVAKGGAVGTPFNATLWFRRLMWLGIGANLVVAAASLAVPERVLGFLGLEPAQPLVWPRFAAFLLVLLSGFYLPSAIDPLRNTYAAVAAVVARFGGVAFFSLVGGRYVVFGLFDLVFGLPQAVLLLLAWRQARRTP